MTYSDLVSGEVRDQFVRHFPTLNHLLILDLLFYGNMK
ncbi:hypothetical protein B4064_1539 [Caldibacillus thermoamylovorans]|nr:hypothetical protein B4064_1539 [Caldibacillus thermoamylovorans]